MDIMALTAYQQQYPLPTGNTAIQMNSTGLDGRSSSCIMIGAIPQDTLNVAAASTSHYDVVMNSVADAIRMIQRYFDTAKPMIPPQFMVWAHYCLNLPLQYPDGSVNDFQPCPPITFDLTAEANNARLTAALAASEANNARLTAALAASEATNANLTAALSEANGAEPKQSAKLQKKLTKAKESLATSEAAHAASEAARAVLTTQLATMIQALGTMKAEVKEDEPEAAPAKRTRGKGGQ